MWSNSQKHFEHPNLALCPTNPQTFRQAGMSQLTQNKQTFTFIDWPVCSFKFTPVQNSLRSSTSGLRYELIVYFGSLGPGIMPTRIAFSCLYLKWRGKFNIIKYNTPTESLTRLYGWNQSTFSASARLYGESKKPVCCSSFHTFPSYTSPSQSWGITADLSFQKLHASTKFGLWKLIDKDDFRLW